MGKEEVPEGIRELQLLEALAEESEVRQVDLAARLGVAVGTVNWLLKRLAAKGYVKVKKLGGWRWSYILTPQGMAEKARLTRAYIRQSMQLYWETRERTQELLREVKRAGYKQVRIEGDNDLVDVCRLTSLEQGVKVIGPARGKGQEDSAREIPISWAELPVLRVDGREISLKLPEREPNAGPDSQRMKENGQLAEIIRRIVEVAQPEKIILFGSAARGEMGPNSDLDLLVVKPGAHRRQLAQKIYMNLFGVGRAVDVVVVTPEDIERYRDSHPLVIRPALQEGKVIYERDSEALSAG